MAMRNSLLSLQNISKLQDKISLNLSTGKKINSALDNPSSYYTAQSLNNRSQDLSSLLDTMGQGIQAIKTATEGVESAAEMLEQMRAVTEQTLTEATYVPYEAKIEFDTNVDALINQGYTAITKDMSLTEVNNLLSQDNAKVVLADDVILDGTISIKGKNVIFNGGGHRLSTRQISISSVASDVMIENMNIVNTTGATDSSARTIYSAGANLTVRNLTIEQNNTIGQASAIELRGRGGYVVENVNISMSGNADQMLGVFVYGVSNTVNISKVGVTISGAENSLIAAVGSHSSQITVNKIGLNASGGTAFGIIGEVNGISGTVVGNQINYSSAVWDGKANTAAIVAQLGQDASAAYATTQFYVGDKDSADFGQGNWYLPSIGELMNMYGTDFDKVTVGSGAAGAIGDNKKAINNALATLKDKGVEAKALDAWYWSSSEANNERSWYLLTNNGYRPYNPKVYGYCVRCFTQVENCFSATSGNKPQIGDVMYADKTWGLADDYDGSKTAVGIITEVDETNGSVKIINLKDLSFSSSSASGNFDPDNPYNNSVTTTRWATGSRMNDDITSVKNVSDFGLVLTVNPNAQVTSVEALNNTFGILEADSYEQRYNNILSQYDTLINDSSYKGVNLLKKDSLKVNFNEDRSSSLTLKGRDMTSNSIGLTLADWAEKEGILKSVQELSAAIDKLRNFSSELGNNYAIITTRQNFTENLINVLEEGADKLTLADMNEESANMLALQTRQQLATNALSLASQAAQSILKLF